MKPISDTAFYCCGIRMRDAESARPICGDHYARRFMDARGLEILRRFGGQSVANASNVARHRYIDDVLRQQLAREPRLQVAVLGCGFDSRAYRLAGGAWYELDEPQLIAYKNDRLPVAQAPNPLQRIAIEFDVESLAEKLRPLSTTAATVFVIEGVTMYLPAASLRATLQVLRSMFAGHRIIADLMTAKFIDRYGRGIKQIIAGMGAHIVPSDTPARAFGEAGYRELSAVAILGLTLGYRSLGALNPLLRLLMSGGYSGYTVRVFEQGVPGAA